MSDKESTEKKAAIAEWITGQLGFGEEARVTWITEDNDMVRVATHFNLGDPTTDREMVKAKRDAALLRMIEEGPESGTNIGKPHWYRESSE